MAYGRDGIVILDDDRYRKASIIKSDAEKSRQARSGEMKRETGGVDAAGEVSPDNEFYRRIYRPSQSSD